MKTKLAPLVVTTAHRGVFFGWGTPSDAPTIRLLRAQMCIYWSEGGVLALAVTGPTAAARVTRPIPAITLRDVTSVMEATAASVAGWEACPWSK